MSKTKPYVAEVDAVLYVGRGERRRGPERGRAQAGLRTFGRSTGAQYGVAAKRAEGLAAVGVDCAEDLTAGKADGIDRGAELRRGDVSELVAQLAGREVYRARHRAGEAAAVVARGDRPGVLRDIELDVTTTCSGAMPNTSVTSCAHTAKSLWPAGAEAMFTVTPPSALAGSTSQKPARRLTRSCCTVRS